MSMRVQVMGYGGNIILHSSAAGIMRTPAVTWGG